MQIQNVETWLKSLFCFRSFYSLLVLVGKAAEHVPTRKNSVKMTAGVEIFMMVIICYDVEGSKYL